MDLFDIEKLNSENEKAKTEQISSRIKELEKLIKYHQNLYYNGEGKISDAEFDKLWDELKSLDSTNPILHSVGADSGNFEKSSHLMPMGSQEKAANPEEFISWAQKHKYPEYLVEYKLDGASLELQYLNGNLLRAVTRGDGTIGDVITSNAIKIQGVKKELFVENDSGKKKFDFTGGIRGEVIMTHDIHAKYFSDKANCRNAANGLMKRKDGQGSEYLTFITYDIWASQGEQPYKDEEDKLNCLKNLGFNTVPLKICKNIDEVINYRSQVMEMRKNIPYDIDGLVVKERIVNHEDALRSRPEHQIAFKFSLEEAVSVLKDVEWSEQGATYTPVAIFEPVELNGTTVKRASLVNTNLIRSLDLKIGNHIVVVKRGEIIPKIINVVHENSSEKYKDIEIPKKCSVCNSELIDEGTRLYCPNPLCPKKVLHQLLKWISVVDIRDLGETLITSLFKTGTVNSITDIYSLTPEKLTPYFLNEESIKDEKKSLGAAKVYSSIQSHRKISLEKFIAGFDIEGIGETQVEKIVDAGYNTFEKITALSAEELSTVYSFADILANTFVKGIKSNFEEMKNLLDKKIIELEQPKENALLQGKSFCFTGELNSMKRTDAQNLVKENGGSVKTSVVKGLSYLVTNDSSSGSSKNLKAAQLGIPIINEKEFLKLLNK